MSDSDFDLLEQWRQGDEIAGNQLFRRHFGPLYRFFRTKVPEDLAEDLTQQAFLGLVEKRDKFRYKGHFKSYLFTIARRQLLLCLRAKHHMNKVFAAEHVSVQEMAGGSLVSAGKMAAAHQEQRVLLAALRQIPLDYQIVVELHYWEGMTMAEIAAVIEVAPGTVNSRLWRALAMLRENIPTFSGPSGVRIRGEDLGHWVQSMHSFLAKPPDNRNNDNPPEA